jgi:hypothetical protein
MLTAVGVNVEDAAICVARGREETGPERLVDRNSSLFSSLFSTTKYKKKVVGTLGNLGTRRGATKTAHHSPPHRHTPVVFVICGPVHVLWPARELILATQFSIAISLQQ